MKGKKQKTTLTKAAEASGDSSIYTAKIAAALARSVPNLEPADATVVCQGQGNDK